MDRSDERSFGEGGDDSDTRPTRPLHFAGLVEGGSDFLHRAIKEIVAEDYKFSVIHFAQAIELFIKARLLLEHWSLILADPKRVRLNDFKKGSFVSVGWEEALSRIERVVEQDYSRTLGAFKPIFERRNRAIHFYSNDSFTNPALRQILERTFGPSTRVAPIVAEQCAAWYELNRLLTVEWSEQFSEYKETFSSLDKEMMQLHPYLKERFDRLAPELKSLSPARQPDKCPACSFKAFTSTVLFEGYERRKCLVCYVSEVRFSFPCLEQGCSERMFISENAEGVCSTEAHKASLVEIAHALKAKQSEWASDTDVSQGYCMSCMQTEVPGGSVVRLKTSGNYVCLSCLEAWSGLSSCGWCGERLAGDTSQTAWLGCPCCDGRRGQDNFD